MGLEGSSLCVGTGNGTTHKVTMARIKTNNAQRIGGVVSGIFRII